MTGPASFRRLGLSGAIPEKFAIVYYLDDQKRRVSVARVNRRLYAFDDLCTCGPQPCPLSGGLLIGTRIMCQCHGTSFDVATGAVVEGQATKSLQTYEVREVDGAVQIRI
jgi:3-phenylpropionate/trans-cinnamate dioxygenase ferredoxin subunit